MHRRRGLFGLMVPEMRLHQARETWQKVADTVAGTEAEGSRLKPQEGSQENEPEMVFKFSKFAHLVQQDHTP